MLRTALECDWGTARRENLAMQDDEARAADRDTAEAIFDRIMREDVERHDGSWLLHGERVKRRIVDALAAARADERQRGFETPMPMRAVAAAQGAAAVMDRWPGIRPLHHTAIHDGVPFRSYRVAYGQHAMISDDARIVVRRDATTCMAEVDGQEVVDCGRRRRFDTEADAIEAAIARMRQRRK
jgi:hypothetical protein